MNSVRGEIWLDQQADVTVMTLHARNPIVSSFILPLGGFVSLGPLTVLAYGLSVSNFVTVAAMAGVTVAVYWVTWWVGWRPRPFAIRFHRDHLEVGHQRFAYSDIEAYGLERYGGAIFDPASMRIPRNYTIGPHIYIDKGGMHLPITVGLKEDQAREALKLFGQLFEAYRSA